MPDPDIEASIRAAVDGLRDRRAPHELARMLRQLAQELDNEPMVMVHGAQGINESRVALEDEFGTTLLSLEGNVDKDLGLEP